MSDDKKQTQPNVGRRDFLRRAGAVVGTAGIMGTAASSNASDTGKGRLAPEYDYDAIVVGGGFAGVTAARELRHDGKKTLLLEARNRLGGRTFYGEFAGHKLDFGGTWIHWSQPFVWAEKERYGLDITETPGAVAPDRLYIKVGDETVEAGTDDVVAAVSAFDLYVSEGRQIMERPYDASHQWNEVLRADAMTATDRMNQLELTDLQRVVLDNIISTTAHSNADTISYFETIRYFGLGAFSYAPFMEAIARYKFKHGTKSLIDKMVEDGSPEVRLSTPVNRIEDLGDKVRITTVRGDEITAGVVVAALPMNTIADIEFSPELHPALVEAATERHAGQGFKVFIKARGRLGNVMSISDSISPIQLLFTYEEADDHTLLVGFGSGQNGLDLYDTEALEAEIAKLIPGVEIESTFSYDWVLDPYSKGTWCSYRPGWAARYYEQFNSDSGRVYFAQGDHGEGWRGTIDGAIGAGLRAAERIRGDHA